MIRTVACLFLCCLAAAGLRAHAGEAAGSDAERNALKKLGGFVGEWRGSGQIKDSGGRDAWVEESEWSWDFKGGHAAIVFKTPKGRFYTAGRLTAGEKENTYVLTATPTEGKENEVFSGEFKDGELVLTNDKAPANRPTRLTLGLVAGGKRLVMGYQRSPRKDKFEPFAELGLTLKGSGFGKSIDMRECIVTGGMGKIAVSHKGTTYYVCCGGCKEAFDENPEKEIADWKARKAAELKK